MNTIQNTFHIKIEEKTNQSVTYGSLTLQMDTTYDEYRHAIQWGYVLRNPKKLTGPHKDKKMPLEGQKVYFHHFVHGDRFKKFDSLKVEEWDQTFYRAMYDQMYAIVEDGKVTMLDEWVFVEPIMEEGASKIIYTPNKGEEREFGILRHINEKTREMGLKEGDKVMFAKNADYDMVIEGEKLFRMKNEYLLAIIE